MTALPDWDIAGPTDAELAGAAATGDRGAFGQIYARYADRLHDFCVGMLRDGDAAADCVQDTFCTAATSLAGLRQPDKLRPWLYAIARNEALRRIRDRRRERVSDELPDEPSAEPGPEILAARSELADLVAEAAGGLSDRDRTVLELAYRHGLDGPELAQAMGVSHSSAKKLVVRLRETIERSLGALLVARRARATPDGCPELTAILDGWDGQFSVLMRKRIARHIESCVGCEEDRRQLVNPVALLGGVPVFIPAPAWLSDRTLNQVRLPGAATSAPPDDGGAPRPGAEPPSEAVSTAGGKSADGRRIGRVLLVAAMIVGTVMVAAGLAIAWWYRPHSAVTPSNVSTAPAPGAPRIVGTTPTTSPPPPGTTGASSSVAPPPSGAPIPPPAVSTAPTTAPAAPPPPVGSPASPAPSTAPTAVPVAPTRTPVQPPPAPPTGSTPPSTVHTGIVPTHGAPRPPTTTSPPTIF